MAEKPRTGRSMATQYEVTLQYLSDPDQKKIVCYEGSIQLTSKEQPVFLTLTNPKDHDMMYIIIDTLHMEPHSPYTMASVLTLSRTKHRHPCSMRMIMSRNAIPIDTKPYHIMRSNLMMNDRYIRIDKYGYNEIVKHREQYNSPALDYFLSLYPNIEAIENSNYIEVNKCAYISENTILSLKNLDMEEKYYLKALLRFHSIAPWYSKANGMKTEEMKYQSL